MLLQSKPPLHLTYCLNIHPGESWPENLAAIRRYTLEVRRQVAPRQPYGLGLRLSKMAADHLSIPARRREARYFFDQNQLYIFTINGFPYGLFHGVRVKDRVYAPDWRQAERLLYTRQLADILADFLPKGVSGSISTVPGTFKPWLRNTPEVRPIVTNLRACAEHLARLQDKTGCEIHVGLEPEPGCLLETTDETVRFFQEELFGKARDDAERDRLRRHIGVCLDTCHVAMQFEDPVEAVRKYQAAGIRISKIQLSAALEVAHDGVAALAPFQDDVYLHQTTALFPDGQRRSWMDLPDFLADAAARETCERVRVHFHLPLFFQGMDALESTVAGLTRGFFDLLLKGVTEHLEIETYTFSVLPPELRAGEVTDSLVREFRWVQGRL